MRQAGTLTNEQDAKRFVDYLLTLGIEAKADHAADGSIIWIYDETRLAEGKAELSAFRNHPQDAKYAEAPRKAEALRREATTAQRRAARNVVDMRTRWSSPHVKGPRPLTWLLIGISAMVGFITSFGEHQEPIYPHLYMVPIGVRPSDQELSKRLREAIRTGDSAKIKEVYESVSRPFPSNLSAIRHGQVWRLVTPIFVHLSLMHLLFNMYWLFLLGGMIEDRYGALWLLALVLITAVISNLTQYYWAGPMFGGMSGVNYALFGYIWMKSKFDPAAGLYIGQRDVFLMLLWFAACFTGWLGPVANGAHAGGLISGAVIGYLPALIRR
jgi:GlpG protein